MLKTRRKTIRTRGVTNLGQTIRCTKVDTKVARKRKSKRKYLRKSFVSWFLPIRCFGGFGYESRYESRNFCRAERCVCRAKRCDDVSKPSKPSDNALFDLVLPPFGVKLSGYERCVERSARCETRCERERDGPVRFCADLVESLGRSVALFRQAV